MGAHIPDTEDRCTYTRNLGVAIAKGFHWKATPSLTKAGILLSCG